MGDFIRKYRIIIRVVTTLLLFISIANYAVFIPKWILAGTQENYKEWFPRVGAFLYFILHYQIDLVVLLIFCVCINYNHIRTQIKHLKYSKTVAFYSCTFLLLIVQFYYNYNFKEFYPSVMMPTFKYGIHENLYTHQYVTVIVVDEKDIIHTIEGSELFTDIPMGKIGSIYASNKLLRLKSSPISDWLKAKSKKLLKIKEIKSIEIKSSQKLYMITRTKVESFNKPNIFHQIQ